MPQTKWYGQSAKKKYHEEGHKRLLAIGHKINERAKDNIEVAVYQTPESPDYLRTGLAKASIHTVDKSDHVLIGANETSFKEDASKLGIDIETGAVTFYLPYIEKGHIMRNGEFYPARPFLIPAHDWARQKWGR